MAIDISKQVELTQTHVKKIFGLSDQDAADWFPHIKSSCDERKINTVGRLSAFLANVKVETGGLRVLTENLNYSSKRLMEVFPKYFKTKEEADAYAGKPEKIANRVYGSRMGNGPEESGDGWRYRGRGCFQLTGQDNYESCTRGGVSCLGANSDYLTTKEGAMRSAAWFWATKGLNRPADSADFDTVVRRINGGTHGLADRRAAYELAIVVLSSLPDGTTINTEPTDPNTGEENQIEVEQKDPSAIQASDALHKTIQEPIVAGQAEYPYNQTFESRSGHLTEIDDTPGAERLHWYHRIGTYVEMQPDGVYSSKVMKDRYVFVNQNYFRDVKGDSTIKVEGQYYTKVGQDYTVEMGGMGTIKSPDVLQLDVPTVNAQETINVPFLNAQMIKMRPGSKSSGMVADLKARDADHADFAEGAKWAMKAGGLGPGVAVPKPASRLAGSWSSLAGDVFWDGNVTYDPVVLPDGSFVGSHDEEWKDVSIESEGDFTTLVEGDSIEKVNGDRLIESGGDVVDHNLGEREIAAGETLKLISDNAIILEAPSLTFAPVTHLLFTPITGVGNLPPASASNNGKVAVFIDMTGALMRAQSNGTTWTILA